MQASLCAALRGQGLCGNHLLQSAVSHCCLQAEREYWSTWYTHKLTIRAHQDDDAICRTTHGFGGHGLALCRSAAEGNSLLPGKYNHGANPSTNRSTPVVFAWIFLLWWGFCRHNNQQPRQSPAIQTPRWFNKFECWQHSCPLVTNLQSLYDSP